MSGLETIPSIRCCRSNDKRCVHVKQNVLSARSQFLKAARDSVQMHAWHNTSGKGNVSPTVTGTSIAVLSVGTCSIWGVDESDHRWSGLVTTPNAQSTSEMPPAGFEDHPKGSDQSAFNISQRAGIILSLKPIPGLGCPSFS